MLLQFPSPKSRSCNHPLRLPLPMPQNRRKMGHQTHHSPLYLTPHRRACNHRSQLNNQESVEATREKRLVPEKGKYLLHRIFHPFQNPNLILPLDTHRTFLLSSVAYFESKSCFSIWATQLNDVFQTIDPRAVVRHLIHCRRVPVTQKPPLYSSMRFVPLLLVLSPSLCMHLNSIEVNIVHVRTAKQSTQLRLLSKVHSFPSQLFLLRTFPASLRQGGRAPSSRREGW